MIGVCLKSSIGLKSTFKSKANNFYCTWQELVRMDKFDRPWDIGVKPEEATEFLHYDFIINCFIGYRNTKFKNLKIESAFLYRRK